MKWLLWALLLANLVFFSFMQWGEAVLGAGKTPPNQSALNAEKIKLLPASSVAQVPISLPSTVPSPFGVPLTSQVQPVNAVACLEWGEF